MIGGHTHDVRNAEVLTVTKFTEGVAKQDFFGQYEVYFTRFIVCIGVRRVSIATI